MEYSHERTHRNYRLLGKSGMCCGLKISLERIKVTYLSKPGEPCQQSKLSDGKSELEGVPESCCLRRSRTGGDGIDKESEVHWKSPQCWERLRAGGAGVDRG